MSSPTQARKVKLLTGKLKPLQQHKKNASDRLGCYLAQPHQIQLHHCGIRCFVFAMIAIDQATHLLGQIGIRLRRSAHAFMILRMFDRVGDTVLSIGLSTQRCDV